MEAQTKCISQIHKRSKRTKKMPPQVKRVEEAVRHKKAPFKNGKSNPSDGDRKGHIFLFDLPQFKKADQEQIWRAIT